MKVLILTGSYYPEKDGVCKYTRNLKEKLCGAGVDSRILTTQAAADASVEAGVLPAVRDWDLPNLAPLVQAIHQQPADLLHVQFAEGSYRFHRSVFWLPMLLHAIGWRKPIVTTLHEYGNWGWNPRFIPRALLEWLKKFGEKRTWWDGDDGFLITLSDVVISTNGTTDKALRQRLPGLIPRIENIPLAANVDVLPIERQAAKKELLTEFGWEDSSAVFAFFGFVHPVKGIETLLKAFRQVIQRQPRARLLILGGSESLALPGEEAQKYLSSLRKLVIELDLQGYVTFTGFIPDDQASRYLRGSDIGVLPFNHGVNLKSGSLLALLSHHLPTIVTRYNPPVSIFEQNEVVEVVEPHDPDGLATAMHKLLSDEQARMRYADSGNRFSQNFSWDRVIERHLQIYQELI